MAVEQDPSIARVTLDVERTHLPELLDQLSGFVLEHNITVAIGDVPQDTINPVTAEGLQYEASRATLLPHPDGEGEIPVVTKANLRNFLIETGQKFGVQERLVNALGHSVVSAPWMEGFLYGTTTEYGHFKAQGIRVSKFKALISTVEADGGRSITNFGQGSIELLQKYAKVLFPETPVDQQM